MDFRPLFVSGMFRSGTTLLARMLNAHPDIVLASDPFLPFLKQLRDELAAEVLPRQDVRPMAPLGDYFADAGELSLYKAVQQASLQRPMKPSVREQLWPVIKDFARPYSPKLTDRLDELKGDTFSELYTDMLRLTGAVYGEGGEACVGSKEVWATEFTPVLHRGIAGVKSIFIVRDPRAVCASKNATDEKYTFLFLTRQWRKLASLAWYYSQTAPYCNEVLLLRYEDLVGDAEAVGQRICSFLDVQYSAKIIDAASLKGGDGSSWRRNSTYGDLQGDGAISSKGVDRWKRVLNKSEIELIEQLAFPLMSLFGYAPISAPGLEMPNRLLFDPPEVDYDELADWIRDYIQVDNITNSKEMAKEYLRLNALKAGGHLHKEIIESLFLDVEIYNACRKQVDALQCTHDR
jgi:hypothetical protein